MGVTSPSLGVYKIQVSSVYSIFERISGLFLVGAILVVAVLLRLKGIFTLNYGFYFLFFSVMKESTTSFIFASILIFILLNFSYHISFGIRYIVWDNYGMGAISVRTLKRSAMVFVVILFFILFLFFIVLYI